MRALTVVLVLLAAPALASDDLCAARSGQCLSACSGSALCVAKCSRAQAACEKNRSSPEERVSMPRRCFDAMGAPLRCDAGGGSPPAAVDPAQLQELAKVANATLTKPWKDASKGSARPKIIEVR